MSNYIKATNFATKDALPAGNAAKVVKGTEIDGEFSEIQTVISTKADTNTPAFSGVPTAPTAAPSVNTTQIATTAYTTAAVGAIPDTLGGQTSAYHLDRTNHTGAQAQSTITDLATDLALKADLVSPAFTGTPTAPTVGSATDSTTTVATTAFVQSAIAGSGLGTQAQNGFEKLPSGTIMQWGRESISGSTSVTVTFPETFTSECYSFTCSSYKSGDNGGADVTELIKTLPTVSTCVVSTNSSHDSILWWAVGK